MDAVKFVKEKSRMCNSMTCGICPVSQNNSGERCICSVLLHDQTEKYVAIVEKWSKEHPEKTRTSKQRSTNKGRRKLVLDSSKL